MAAEADVGGASPRGKFRVDPSPSAPAIGELPVDAALTDLIVEAFEGERDEAGRMTGAVKVSFHGGHSYEGAMRDGMMHGAGTYTWSDGVVYAGSFACNKVTGEGTFTWPDGSIYVGQVRNGLRHGSGRFQCGKSPAHYDGEWADGRRHGSGTLFYDAEERSFYRGTWHSDRRHGTGTLVYLSGNVYSGGWKDDKKHGEGKMEWKTRREVYTGGWQADKPHGRGLHVWDEQRAVAGAAQKQMCNRYEGQFADGLRHGVGIFYYSNGSTYDGEWDKNLKHGRGVFTFQDGEIYEGDFVSDRMADPRRPRDKSRSAAGESRMISLRIDDLLQGVPALRARREQREAYNVLLRWNSDLKQMYQYYSVLGTSKLDAMFTMSTKQFWRFIKDSNIPDSILTVVAIDRVVLNMRKLHANAVQQAQLKRLAADLSPRSRRDKENELATVACVVGVDQRLARGSGSHDPRRPILFREFLEALVRIAAAKYPEGGRLAQRLQRLLALTRKGAMKEATDPFRRLMIADDVRDVLLGNEPLLRAVFLTYAIKDKSTRAAMQQDKSINVREFMLLLKDCGVINASFGMGDVMRIFLKANYTVESDMHTIAGLEDHTPVDNLDSEMIFAEFVEAVARVAHQVYHLTRGEVAERQLTGELPTLIEEEPANPRARLSLPERLKFFLQAQLVSLADSAPAVRKVINQKGTAPAPRRGSFMFV